MATSLQDQLLKAGLVDQKKVKQANKDKRKNAKQQRHSKTAVVDDSKQAAQQALKDKAARDREQNAKRNQEAERKAIIAQIKQLIELNRITREGGETAYNFVDNKKVKKIYVTDVLHGQLSRGQLAVVTLNGQYELVPAPVAQKIADRDVSFVISLHDASQHDDEEDEYADYKIPDDLMW